MEHDKQKRNRPGRTLILLYWLGLVVLFTLLGTATYTWFALSRTPRVNDLYLSVAAPTGLEIALEADAEDEDWGQFLDFEDMVEKSSPLRPCTWSDRQGIFLAAVYGMDGRLADRWEPLNDDSNANKEDANGYYIHGTFFARTDAAVKVSLAPAESSADGTESYGTYLIGSPVWNGAALVHDDGGQGAQYAIRIGLRITPVDEKGEANGDSVFYIYEPNCDGHADGSTGYVETPSIDGGNSLVPTDRLYPQTASQWSEVFPVQRTVTLRTMGEFTVKDTPLFSLQPGEKEKIEVYIWLEGQDADCSILLNTHAQILASIRFSADYSGQSGMVPIED